MNINELYKYQNTYLEILEELFSSLVGKDAIFFHSFDEVLQFSKNNLERFSGISNPYVDFFDKLTSLYSKNGTEVYKFAQELNTCKLVLGGSSRFYGSHLNATRSSLLFADTVLIPDPILPYLERERIEERFQYIPVLKAVFFILQLRTLNSFQFDILPFIIFPSWEKSLESKDAYTQQQTKQLLTDIFSYYVDDGIQVLEDAHQFSQSHKDIFFRKVQENRLFVAPGEKPGGKLQGSIEHYKKEMKIWRSEEWCKKHLNISESQLIINAICERIIPQYHLLENSIELNSNPLLCIDSQAHYYQLVSSMKNSFITEINNEDRKTNAIIKALVSPRMDFLANIPYDQMINIRQSNENVLFRKELRGLVNSLPSTKLEDLNIVAGEVCTYIEALVSQHRKEIEGIRSKYKAKHIHTAGIGYASLAVTMSPMLAPLVGLGLIPTGGKYIMDKLQERNELKKVSNSLMGVISLAKK
ncbi:MAG: hypothetical protein ABGX70_05895 [Psychrobacter sp.]